MEIFLYADIDSLKEVVRDQFSGVVLKFGLYPGVILSRQLYDALLQKLLLSENLVRSIAEGGEYGGLDPQVTTK